MGYTLLSCENLYAYTATIALGESESEAIPTHGMAPVGILMSANWTAADIGVKVGLAADALAAPKDNVGGVLKTTATAATPITLPFSDAVWWPYISLTSLNTVTGAAENQEAARSLTVLFRKYLS